MKQVRTLQEPQNAAETKINMNDAIILFPLIVAGILQLGIIGIFSIARAKGRARQAAAIAEKSTYAVAGMTITALFQVLAAVIIAAVR